MLGGLVYNLHLFYGLLYFHCRTAIQIRTQTRIPNLIATEYYAEHVSTAYTQIWIPFPNGYCTHFRDGSPSQGQISVPITYISIRGSESKSEQMEKSCIVQESESEYGNGNKRLL